MEFEDEKLSFSKRVVGTVTWLFVGIIIFSAGTWLLYREIPDDLINYVDDPFSIIISGYFAKAGMENFLKLRGGVKETVPRKGE
ncbi:hypothetical protein [uncultured Phascolarctobacterium sp.]|uniref:hypothetical protein n=1 Tax=Phascolarctobacterium sp. TaxID=2049039 RepID=UPI0025F62C0C|nr:hypothetical protein [uncultured Phascolarctobacterium sp.]